LGNRQHRRGSDRVEQLAPGQEDDAGAAQRQDDSERARILLQVMLAALDGADRDRIGDQECLEPGLDGEQAGEALKHEHG
jgi:hypothetical protein